MGDARDEWRPIATAPKDGTRVLVRVQDSQGVRALIAQWAPFTERWYADDDTEYRGSVTHWQPVPSCDVREPRFTRESTLAEIEAFLQANDADIVRMSAVWEINFGPRVYVRDVEGNSLLDALNAAHEAVDAAKRG